MPTSEELVETVAGALSQRVPEIAQRLEEEVAEHLPDAVADDELRELLLAGARANVALVCAMAADGTDPSGAVPPPEAERWSRATARAGLSIEDVLAVYRLGHARLWQLWHDELAARCDEPAVLTEAVARSSAFLFGWVDAMSGPVVRVHDEERQRRARGAEAARADAVQAVLRGDVDDLPAVSARLRYALDRHHTALVAWVDDVAEPAEEEARLQEAVALVAAWVAPGAPVLSVRGGPQSLWAWIATHEAPPSPGPDRPAVADLLHARVAVGASGHGPDGFRTSHDEARATARVARTTRAGDASGVTRHDDVAAVALLTEDRARAERFAARRLAPIADDAKLLDALRAYVEEGSSLTRAARRLGVHENTLSYRVRRALELLGEPDGTGLELRAAIAVRDALP